jgi:hypothetical protein
MVALASLLVGKWIVGIVGVLTTLRLGAGVYVWRVTENLERPVYTVIGRLSDGVELRRYDPYLIAETIVDGTGFRKPTGDGFRSCAGYIFGKNKPRRRPTMLFHSRSSSDKGETMAMTAPVRVSGASSSSASSSNGEKMAMTAPVRVAGGHNTKKTKKTKVSFVIGKQYSLNTVPQPVDPNVKLRQVPAHTLAVRTFSGPPPKDDRVERERAKVQRALEKANLEPRSSSYQDTTLVYGYHDPFLTPNFLRRNEVALVVDGTV